MVQSEVDARRRLLEVKKSTAEQRWAVEDLQVYPVSTSRSREREREYVCVGECVSERESVRERERSRRALPSSAGPSRTCRFISHNVLIK